MTAMFDRRRFFGLAGMGVTAGVTAGVMAGCGLGSRPVRRFTFSVTTRGRVWANIEEFANHGSIYNTWPLRAEKQFVSNRWGIPLRDPR